jgi:hypothetical protein
MILFAKNASQLGSNILPPSKQWIFLTVVNTIDQFFANPAKVIKYRISLNLFHSSDNIA